MQPNASGSVISRMHPDDVIVLEEMRELWRNGAVSNLSWNQLLLVAQEEANFPGKAGALQNFFRDKSN